MGQQTLPDSYITNNNFKVGSHDKISHISWYKILYQGRAVSTGKFSPHLYGNFASFGCLAQYVCEMACLQIFFLGSFHRVTSCVGYVLVVRRVVGEVIVK
jgi:hypothetical protein